MISFSHIYKTYRDSEGRSTHALRDVSFQVGKGEFVYLSGPSGAGKTTLFRMMSAFDRPSSGAVSVAGYDLATLSASELPLFRRRIGVVFQDFKLLRDRTVLENVMLPLDVIGDSTAGRVRRVMDGLAGVGLAHKAEEFPEALSGGEQQRVAIARALIHKPGLLIADEPTGNLDAALSLDIMNLFEKANAQGTTVFIATHDQSIIRSRPKRVLRISGGEIRDEQEAVP